MARRTRGRIPAAGCKRAGNAARRPFLLSPIGLRVFLAWPALLGRASREKKPACRRQPAGRCEASATPLRVLPPPSRLGQAKNPAATRHFVIFSQVQTV